MDKLTQVIDMIEHPEHYSESQIKEILQDEESRQTYLTMMEMRMAFDKEATEKDLDVDKEWQMFAVWYRLCCHSYIQFASSGRKNIGRGYVSSKNSILSKYCCCQ